MQVGSEMPLWLRLMSLSNLVGLAAYFSVLGAGFWGLKILADDDGSESTSLVIFFEALAHYISNLYRFLSTTEWLSNTKLPVRGKHLDDFNVVCFPATNLMCVDYGHVSNCFLIPSVR